MAVEVLHTRVPQIFQKSRHPLQILGAGRVTWRCHTEVLLLRTSLLRGAFCRMHMNWYTFVDAGRKKKPAVITLNIRRHRTKFCRLGDQAPWIYFYVHILLNRISLCSVYWRTACGTRAVRFLPVAVGCFCQWLWGVYN